MKDGLDVRDAAARGTIGAVDTDEDASFPKLINFFAAEPESARELFHGDEIRLGVGHMVCRGDRSEVAV
jgi:hypothetical protein